MLNPYWGGSAGIIEENDSTSKSMTQIGENHKVLKKMLDESQNWKCTLLFEESEPDAEDSQTVDLIKELEENSYVQDRVYIFPEQFQGEEAEQNLRAELKIASMLSGFNLFVRSRKDKTQKNGLHETCRFDVQTFFGCQQSQLYNDGKVSNILLDRKYATTSLRPIDVHDKCPFKFTIALLTKDDPEKVTLCYKPRYKPRCKTQLSPDFIRQNAGRWILLPKSKVSERYHSGSTCPGNHCSHVQLHPSLLLADRSLMTDEQRKLAKNCSQVSFNTTATTALLNNSEDQGIQWKPSQIKYLNHKEQDQLKSITNNPSSADQIMETFSRRNHVNFMSVTYNGTDGLMLLLTGKVKKRKLQTNILMIIYNRSCVIYTKAKNFKIQNQFFSFSFSQVLKKRD